jgi:predicted MFS family arabinose efflux permease
MFEPYVHLLRRPHFLRLAVSAASAFIPFGMLPLALVLFVHDATGSYAKAGVVAGAANLGRAFLSPGRARSVDRHGAARLLPLLAAAYLVLVAVLVGVADAGGGVVALAMVAIPLGAAPPPVNATLRSVWTPLVPPEERQTAYAVQTVVQESAFVSAPLLTALVVSLASPAAALWTSAGAMLVGTLVFASTPPVRAHSGSGEHYSTLTALRRPGMRVLLFTVVAFAACFGALDVAAPAFAGEHGSRALSGVMLGALSIGVLVGTFAYGTRRPSRRAGERYPGSCALAAGGLALMLLGMSIPDMTAWMALTGVALAPATTCGFLVLADLAVPSRMIEATAWFSSAAAAGLSLGSLLGGFAVEGLGPRGGIAASVACGVCAWAVAQSGRRALRVEPVAA